MKSSFFSNRQRPTFPGSFPPSIIGAKELNYCVRDGNRCILPAIVTGFLARLFTVLLRHVSCFAVLTYPSTLRSSTFTFLALQRKSFAILKLQIFVPSKLKSIKPYIYPNHWSSFRPISIGQLNISLCLHLRPINVIVSHGSYLKGGNLFLWGASHLDAFSAYPVRR